MNTAQAGFIPTAMDVVRAPLVLGAAVVEGGYLAEALALQLSELWLHTASEGIKREHDLLMAMMEYPLAQNVEPWNSLDQSNGDGSLPAVDTALGAFGG